MVRIAYAAAATLALIVGIAAGWTWQQWQPSHGVAAAVVEATR